MNGSFDVVIVGLGAMGSAAAYHLARRRKRVLGLDRFTPPHSLGSSHGQTRIIRQAYFEHPIYVPIVKRAYGLWAELEQEVGRELFHQTGGLMIGRPEGTLVTGARHSAQIHHLPHEMLSATDVHRRFPALHPDYAMVAVWEPHAGILFPEACIEAHLEMARRHSAQLQYEEPVIAWEVDETGVRVITPKSHYQADQLLLTAGPWMGSLIPDLALPLTVERQGLFWFEPQAHPERFSVDKFSIYLWEYESDRFFYGFPNLGKGLKVARHHEGEAIDPDKVRREVGPDEVETMRAILRRFIPDADGTLRSTDVCLYTNTPDSHFLIDFHPSHLQVLIASPCSGHGFKFSSAMGEILADLLVEGASSFDLSLFQLKRFSSSIGGRKR
jgi:sarcosine oxidase